MSISIKKNIKPTFENVEMLCDKPLSKSLSKYDLTKFFNCFSTNFLIGKPGSGKTTLMISLFNYFVVVFIIYFYFSLHIQEHQ
jgi:DNA replication protein DnaC